MGKNKNLVIDANIIYELAAPFKEKIFDEYMDSRKKIFYLNKLNSRYQEGDTAIDLMKLESNAEILKDFFGFYQEFDNIFIPNYIKKQCHHEIADVSGKGLLLEYRLSGYLSDISKKMNIHDREKIDEAMKLVLTYKNVFSFLDKVSENKFDLKEHMSNNIYLKAFEDFMREMTNTFDLKKNGHSNDRKVDEKLSSLIMYSSFLGNDTISFSNDSDVRKMINLAYLGLKNGSNIASSNALEKLLLNPPIIAECQTQKHLYFKQKRELKLDLTIEEYLKLEDVDVDRGKLFDFSKTTIHFLKSIDCY